MKRKERAYPIKARNEFPLTGRIYERESYLSFYRLNFVLANGADPYMSTRIRNSYQPSFSIVTDPADQIREMVHQQVRGAALSLVQGLLMEDVEALCGKVFSRKGLEGHCRGGSDPGSVILQGQRIAVKKPRVKKAGKEVELQTYAALQGYDLLQERIVNHMVNGVSTRDYDELLEEVSGGLGLKKSSVSKAFVRGSREALELINGRDLSFKDPSESWMSVMIDGIEFGGSCVIVALGITTSGKKLILGLKKGDTENWEVCKDLLQELAERGLSLDSPMLFVLDGSKALKKAVRKVFGESHPIQRCVRHKERNCLSYLPQQFHPEFRRRWKLLHGMSRFDDAKLEYDRLVHWLGQRNQEALASLEEADMETLTVIQLKAGPLLRKTLCSTNPIESAFSRVRSRTGRVKNWKSGQDQVTRWSASNLLEAEKKFRIIKGHKEISSFLVELKNFNLPSELKVA
jgi:putative transposase